MEATEMRLKPVMSISRLRGWRFWVIALAAVAITAPLLGAQAPNSVPGMLDQIITMLQSVQQSLDGLTQATESNVRITPVIDVVSAPNLIDDGCLVTNIT